MKRKIVLGVSAGLISAVAFAGAAFAQETTERISPVDSMKLRVVEILGVEIGELGAAIRQARQEYIESKREEKLLSLVEEGLITQKQTDEMRAWRESRPEIIVALKRFGRGSVAITNIQERLSELIAQETISQAEADAVIA